MKNKLNDGHDTEGVLEGGGHLKVPILSICSVL